jgi:hypothetical protein
MGKWELQEGNLLTYLSLVLLLVLFWSVLDFCDVFLASSLHQVCVMAMM